ncbi:hypothetical protein Vretimale_15181 [Volvox reticuliferus]|uniref:Glycosyl transferase family 1 domain-containing protein n=1 Tax=Volvox reticuliferus TaxID=1737510 RepID=A0A8J4LVW5_9CHLO|nr:hypothetical protein Vretimale_15181 [Volvox reticuliferus]
MRAFLEEFSPEPRQQSATVEQFRVTGPGNAVEARATGPAARAAIAGRRKGPAKAAEGPCSDKSDVVLYLLTKPFLPKASGAGLAEHVRKWARDAQPELDLNQVPRVYVMDGHVPRKDYVAMLAAADAFVLATRGEGWGLPILEAMSLGLPVIATNWSGPTAYLDERVGYPLSYSLKPVPSTEPYWFQGSSSHLEVAISIHLISFHHITSHHMAITSHYSTSY